MTDEPSDPMVDLMILGMSLKLARLRAAGARAKVREVSFSRGTPGPAGGLGQSGQSHASRGHTRRDDPAEGGAAGQRDEDIS